MQKPMENLSKEEIIEIMSKPKSEALMKTYFQIWLQATGRKFKPSNCCGTFTRLYTTCINYSNKLKQMK